MVIKLVEYPRHLKREISILSHIAKQLKACPKNNLFYVLKTVLIVYLAFYF